MLSVDSLFHQGPNGAVITVQGAGVSGLRYWSKQSECTRGATSLMFSVDSLFHQGPNGAVITVQHAGVQNQTLV